MKKAKVLYDCQQELYIIPFRKEKEFIKDHEELDWFDFNKKWRKYSHSEKPNMKVYID